MHNYLEEYYCIFIDILGYSRRIKEAEKNNYLQSELDNFLEYVGFENKEWEIIINILNKDNSKSKSYFKIFSDNIFVALPKRKDFLLKFHSILGHIISYQCFLLEFNYFIRGGVSTGKLYIDENTIFGPAIIDAVTTEKETCYPFVRISDEVINIYEKYNLIGNCSSILDIPIIRTENHYLLDYLSYRIDQNQNPIIWSFLENHKNEIEKNLSSNIEPIILEKYIYLAKYHNKYCRSNCLKFPELKKYEIKNFNLSNDIVITPTYLQIPNFSNN